MRRFERDADAVAVDAAILAAIAQAVTPDTHEVKDPAGIPTWYQLCGEMRDAAGQLNAAAKAKDAAGAEKALGLMTQKCDRCHSVFRVEQVQ
jgi:cytochrome c556